MKLGDLIVNIPKSDMPQNWWLSWHDIFRAVGVLSRPLNNFSQSHQQCIFLTFEYVSQGTNLVMLAVYLTIIIGRAKDKVVHLKTLWKESYHV